MKEPTTPKIVYNKNKKEKEKEEVLLLLDGNIFLD